MPRLPFTVVVAIMAEGESGTDPTQHDQRVFRVLAANADAARWIGEDLAFRYAVTEFEAVVGECGLYTFNTDVFEGFQSAIQTSERGRCEACAGTGLECEGWLAEVVLIDELPDCQLCQGSGFSAV